MDEVIRRAKDHVSSDAGISNEALERLCVLSCGSDFKGVFAADCIPSRLAARPRFVIVVNLGTRKDVSGPLPLGHFVTLAGVGDAVRYVDPYGFPCHQPNVLAFLKLCRRQTRYSLRQVQDFGSLYCGMYALLFATYFDRGGGGGRGEAKKLRFFRRGKDLRKNDRLCMKYLREYVAERNT